MNNFNKPAPRPCYPRAQRPVARNSRKEKSMGRIISDVSKRVLIVEGYDQVKRITSLERKEGGKTRIINVKTLAKDVFEIELISRVGSFIE